MGQEQETGACEGAIGQPAAAVRVGEAAVDVGEGAEAGAAREQLRNITRAADEGLEAGASDVRLDQVVVFNYVSIYVYICTHTQTDIHIR